MWPVTSPYRRVLSIPGAVAFSAAGVVARLPIAMVSLGIVLLVSDRTGSYATAGGVAAAYVAATAVGAVPLARLVDRLGQGRVLGPAVSVSCLGLAMLMLAVENDWPSVVTHGFAVLAGLTMPNVGAAVRTRWSHAVQDRALLDTAFAVEAVNDELVFILGPTAVTLLAAGVHPLAGLLTALVTALVGTWLLVAQRRTEPPRHWSSSGRRVPSPMPWLGLAPLVVGAIGLGTLFGGSEVAVVAFTDERQSRGTAGILLAVWALGSLLAGVISGSITFRRTPAARYRIGTACLALLMLPLPFVDGPGVMAIVLFLAGFAISPTMIAAVSWVEAVVPRDRLNEGMTLFTTGMVAGVAPGAAVVGMVVDRFGASASFWVPASAGLVSTVVALLPTGRRVADEPREPAGRR
jgi:predicted MFS family arabinose efflux permease